MRDSPYSSAVSQYSCHFIFHQQLPGHDLNEQQVAVDSFAGLTATVFVRSLGAQRHEGPAFFWRGWPKKAKEDTFYQHWTKHVGPAQTRKCIVTSHTHAFLCLNKLPDFCMQFPITLSQKIHSWKIISAQDMDTDVGWNDAISVLQASMEKKNQDINVLPVPLQNCVKDSGQLWSSSKLWSPSGISSSKGYL